MTYIIYVMGGVKSGKSSLIRNLMGDISVQIYTYNQEYQI